MTEPQYTFTVTNNFIEPLSLNMIRRLVPGLHGLASPTLAPGESIEITEAEAALINTGAGALVIRPVKERKS